MSKALAFARAYLRQQARKNALSEMGHRIVAVDDYVPEWAAVAFVRDAERKLHEGLAMIASGILDAETCAVIAERNAAREQVLRLYDGEELPGVVATEDDHRRMRASLDAAEQAERDRAGLGTHDECEEEWLRACAALDAMMNDRDAVAGEGEARGEAQVPWKGKVCAAG